MFDSDAKHQVCQLEYVKVQMRFERVLRGTPLDGTFE